MAPVEHIKWMTSTWDCTLGHGCVYCASRLTKWTALVVSVFTVELLWTVFQQLLPPPSPPRCLPPAHPLTTLAQNWCAPSKKRPKIKQVTNSNLTRPVFPSLAEPDPHANGGLGTYAIISRAKGMQLKARKN